MRALCVAIALGGMATIATSCAHHAGSGDAMVTKSRIEKAKASVKPALVRIQVLERGYRDGREDYVESTGSGAIISPDGLVVTNHHVAGKAARLKVTMPTKEELPAILIGTDAMTDIAVIKIQPPDGRTFTYAPWGDSDKMDVGDPVLAMGSPLSLSQSVTLGILSNIEMIMPRVWGDNSFDLDGEDVGEIVRWFGHDAVIFPGNSGGPLVNLDGEIIGVNEIGYGLGGAVPGNLAREVAEEIVKNGKVERAYTGLMFQPLLPAMGRQTGALVMSVLRDSPAAKAGIQPGDILLSVDGQETTARFFEQIPPLNKQLADLAIGREVTVKYLRAGAEATTPMAPVTREAVIQPERALPEWGMSARNLSVWTMIDKNRDTREGVLVTSIGGGSPIAVAKPPIQRGDVILRVGDKDVKSVGDLVSVTAAIVKNSKEPVPTLITFERDGKQLLTSARIGIEDVKDPSRDAVKPWVPIDTQVLTKDLAKGLGLEGKKGVRVSQVYGEKNNPEAPFKVGDIIVAIDDEPVAASEPHDSELFNTMIRQYRNNAEVTFKVLRDGNEIAVPMKLPPRPPSARELRKYRDLTFNFTVREVSYLDKQQPSWAMGNKDAAIIVESVMQGGWAALARLAVGDKLLQIDSTDVKDLESVKKALAAAREAKAPHVVLKVQRGPHTRFIQIEPDWQAVATAN